MRVPLSIAGPATGRNGPTGWNAPRRRTRAARRGSSTAPKGRAPPLALRGEGGGRPRCLRGGGRAPARRGPALSRDGAGALCRGAPSDGGGDGRHFQHGFRRRGPGDGAGCRGGPAVTADRRGQRLRRGGRPLDALRGLLPVHHWPSGWRRRLNGPQGALRGPQAGGASIRRQRGLLGIAVEPVAGACFAPDGARCGPPVLHPRSAPDLVGQMRALPLHLRFCQSGRVLRHGPAFARSRAVTHEQMEEAPKGMGQGAWPACLNLDVIAGRPAVPPNSGESRCVGPLRLAMAGRARGALAERVGGARLRRGDRRDGSRAAAPEISGRAGRSAGPVAPRWHPTEAADAASEWRRVFPSRRLWRGPAARRGFGAASARAGEERGPERPGPGPKRSSGSFGDLRGGGAGRAWRPGGARLYIRVSECGRMSWRSHGARSWRVGLP